MDGKPLLVIEAILALALAVFAIYLGGPWYVGEPTTTIGTAIEEDVVRFITAIIYLVPSVMVLAGIGKSKMRARGLFGLFMVYLFSVILEILTLGFSPLFWVFILALCLISGILYIVEARRLDDDGAY